MDNLLGLGLLFEFKDVGTPKILNLQRNFEKARASAKDLTETFNNLQQASAQYGKLAFVASATGFGFQVAGRQILGTLAPAIEEAKNFETAMETLRFTTEATDATFAKLRNTAIDVGIETVFSPREAAEGLTALASSGLTIDQSLKSIKSTLDLVALSAGQIDLSRGAALMSATLQKFNLDAGESQRVADVMVKTANNTALAIQEFPAFVNSLGDAAQKLGAPLEEVFALGGMLRNIGQGSAQAGMSVRGFGRQLLMLTSQMDKMAMGKKGTAVKYKKQLLDQLGLSQETIWDAKGNMRSLTEIFENLTLQMAGMTQKQKANVVQQLFHDQAGSVLSAVDAATKSYVKFDKATGKYIMTSKDGRKTFRQIVEDLKNTNGEAKGAANKMLKTWWGVLQMWQGSLETVRQLLGESLFPVMSAFLTKTTFLMNILLKIARNHPIVAKALGYGIGLTGLLLLVGGGLLMVAGAASGAIASILSLSGATAQYAIANGWAGASTNMLAFALRRLYVTSIRPVLFPMMRMALIAGLVYMAWKTNAFGIRTFAVNIEKAWTKAGKAISGSTRDLAQDFVNLKYSTNFWDNVTAKMMQVRAFIEILADAWGDYNISSKHHQQMEILGLTPIINKILDWKRSFESILPVLNKLSGGVAKLLGWLGGLIIIVKIANAVRTILPLLMAGGRVLLFLGKTAGFLIPVLFRLGAAIMANPIGMWVTIIGLVVLGLIWMVRNWDKVKKYAVIAIQAVGKALTWLGGWIVKAVKIYFAPFIWYFNTIKTQFLLLVDFVRSIWDRLFSGIGDRVKAFGDKIHGLLVRLRLVKDTGSSSGTPVSIAPPPMRSLVSGIPAMASGGRVLGTGVALLHPNELVLNDPTARKLDSFLQSASPVGGSTSTTNDVNITFENGAIQVNVAQATKEEASNLADEILRQLERKMKLKKIMAVSPAGA